MVRFVAARFYLTMKYDLAYLAMSEKGTVENAVASDTRGPRFECSYEQYLVSTVSTKDENKEKEVGYGPFR